MRMFLALLPFGKANCARNVPGAEWLVEASTPFSATAIAVSSVLVWLTSSVCTITSRTAIFPSAANCKSFSTPAMAANAAPEGPLSLRSSKILPNSSFCSGACAVSGCSGV